MIIECNLNEITSQDVAPVSTGTSSSKMKSIQITSLPPITPLLLVMTHRKAMRREMGASRPKFAKNNNSVI